MCFEEYQSLLNDADYLWNPFTNMRTFKLLSRKQPSAFITRGEGIYVYNHKDQKFINGFSSMWNVALGFGRMEIVNAISAQLLELPFSSTFRQTHPKAIQLAKKLIDITHNHYGHVYLGSNGSEAVEAAIMIARQYYIKCKNKHNKGKIISLKNAYHGVSYGAMNASGDHEKVRTNLLTMPGFVQIPPPYCYRCPFDKMQGSCNMECAHYLQTCMDTEVPGTIAAFILEPIMGVGGIITPPLQYYEIISHICNQNDVILIADEVTTGFGRTGQLFSSSEWNIKPDILCLGKAISNGYLPLSATLVTNEIFSGFSEPGNEFKYGSTASGHPVCAAAGLATIDCYENEPIVKNMQHVSDFIFSALNDLKARKRTIGDVRGRGLMIGIELVENKDTKQPLRQRDVSYIMLNAMKKGLLVYNSPDSSIIGLFPPLIIDCEIAQAIVDILDHCIK